MWSSAIYPAFGSFQQSSVTKRSQKPRASTAESGALVEQFSFSLNDFKMDHQGENNNLNITISYRYKDQVSNAEYPDFRVILKDVEGLLTNYPNRDDYWEIVNKKITLTILEKYPAVAQITSHIQVSPSPNVPYLRSSIVTRNRTSVRKK